MAVVPIAMRLRPVLATSEVRQPRVSYSPLLALGANNLRGACVGKG